jgi:hypothetical protein
MSNDRQVANETHAKYGTINRAAVLLIGANVVIHAPIVPKSTMISAKALIEIRISF